MKRPGYLANYRTLGQGPVEATGAANKQVPREGRQGSQPDMVISGTLVPTRIERQCVGCGSEITALAIYVSPGLGSTGSTGPVGRTYQIRNWKSFPKLIAEAQGCQDLPPTNYCRLTIKAKAKESILSGGEEYIYAVGNNTIPIEITQIIELCKSSSIGRSVPLKTCRPGSDYGAEEYISAGPDIGPCKTKDGTAGTNTIAGCIPIKALLALPPRRQPSTKPPVKKEKDYSKHLIIGGIVLSILMSALALKI